MLLVSLWYLDTWRGREGCRRERVGGGGGREGGRERRQGGRAKGGRGRGNSNSVVGEVVKHTCCILLVVFVDCFSSLEHDCRHNSCTDTRCGCFPVRDVLANT